MQKNILKNLGITAEEFTEIVNENPSLRGFISGYISEYKLRQILSADGRITNVRKYDDHDRTKKSDIVFDYKGFEISVEVKSLQTKTIHQENGIFVGKTQCDASDKRPVKFPSGNIISTTLLLVGGFDLLAVNLFAFENKWRFIFAKNSSLPTSTFKGYTPEQRKYLISSLISVSWPPQPPFTDDMFEVLDALVEDKQAKTQETNQVIEIQESKNGSS